MESARGNHVQQDMAIEKKPMDMTGSTRKKSLRPQIERLPSVRTIPLKLNNTPLWERFISKTENGRSQKHKKPLRKWLRSGYFLWPDSEKALKSRAFGQNEKVGNFYQNYLPFVAEMEGFEPPGGVTRQLISSQPRYDHFDTSPFALSLYPKFWEKSR